MSFISKNYILLLVIAVLCAIIYFNYFYFVSHISNTQVKKTYFKRNKSKKNKTKIDKSFITKIDDNLQNSEYKNLYEDCNLYKIM